MIIVDNLPSSYSNHPSNGLPIESWYGSISDRELDMTFKVLECLSSVHDVRDYIPKIVVSNKISMGNLYSETAHTRPASSLDNILDSFNDLKKGAANFFGFSSNSSTNEDSKDNSLVEDNDENFDINIPLFAKNKPKQVVSPTEKMFKIDKDGTPLCESSTPVSF